MNLSFVMSVTRWVKISLPDRAGRRPRILPQSLRTGHAVRLNLCLPADYDC